MSFSNNNQLVSVIIPIYNVAAYLHQCIQSICTQSFKSIEIILVNDGSTDESRIICEYFARLDERIHLINQKNKGLVSARKAGLKKAQGNYVLYVDGDDWLYPNCVEKLILASCGGNSDVVLAGFSREFVGKEVTVAPKIRPGTYLTNDIEQNIFPNMIFDVNTCSNGMPTYSWGKLFKRELLEKFQYPVPDSITVGEDTVVTYPVLANSNKLSVIHEPVYFYRQREQSMLKKISSSNDEILSINTMCCFLAKQMEATSFCFNSQIDSYRTLLTLLRTGGLMGEGKIPTWLFSQTLDFSKQRIVLYSSGSFGQAMWRFFGAAGYNFFGWVDEDAYESQLWGLPVRPLDDITAMNPDVCVISTFDQVKFINIRNKLAPYLNDACVVLQPILPATTLTKN